MRKRGDGGRRENRRKKERRDKKGKRERNLAGAVSASISCNRVYT